MHKDYQRVERAIHFIRDHATTQPSLSDISAHVGLSAWHFQRLFRQWAGISPKRYLEYLTVARAQGLLRDSHAVLGAAYELGLTTASRLHDQFVSVQAMSPGEFQRFGEGLEIKYGYHRGPFGDMLLAQTHRGVCLLSFIAGHSRTAEFERLRRQYPKAALARDDAAIATTAARIFYKPMPNGEKFHLAIRGTNFQVNVWRALLRIPRAQVLSYRDVAHAIGRPDAVRAVAGAIAANPVNFLIPCHRVLRSSGELGGFRGGKQLKERLIAWEQWSLGLAEDT